MITQNTILNVTLRYVHHRLTRAHTMCSSYYNDVQVDGVEIEQTTFAARRKHKNVRACVCVCVLLLNESNKTETS